MVATLTPRQVEVVCLCAQGCTNRQIAALLGISPRTVGDALQRAYRRMGVRDRTAAVVALAKRARDSAPPGSGPG